MFAEDLSIFFDPDDFAVGVTRERASAADVTFPAHKSTGEDEALEGHVNSDEIVIHFARADVLEGDVLQIVDSSVGPDAVAHRVLSVYPVNDGAEMRALLTTATY